MSFLSNFINKHRLLLSSKYLDIVETLPKFGGGTIARLQTIREHGKKSAQRDFERTRAPENTNFSLISIRMSEMFQLEEFEALRSSLVSLFPNLSDPLYLDSLTRIQSFAENIDKGWHRIGTVEREATLLGITNRHLAPELSKEISHIDISLQKILPSIFLINFDIHLTENATENLRIIHNRQYNPEVVFSNLLPWKLLKTGYSTTSPESVIQREVLEYINNLQLQVETFVEKYFTGHFLASNDKSKQNRSRIPAIKVFSVSGAPYDSDAWKKWENEAKSWYSSLGFDFWLGAYGSEDLICIIADKFKVYEGSKLVPKNRVVVFEDKFIEQIDLGHFGGNKNFAIFHSIEHHISELMPLIVIQEFLGSSENLVRSFRKLTYDKIKSRSRFRKHIRINEQIHEISILIQIISEEFSRSKDWIGGSNNRLLNLEHKWRKEEKNETITLKEDILFQIDYQIERLLLQISHLETRHKNYLSLRNMEAIYYLQAIAAVAAVFSIIATILIANNFIEWLIALLR